MEESQLVELLSKPKWWIMRRASEPERDELTTLDEKDIQHIVGDMNLKKAEPPIVKVDGEKVIVEYPASNGCRLESSPDGVYVGVRMLLADFGLAFVKEKDADGKFFVKSPTTHRAKWLTEQEIFDQILH